MTADLRRGDNPGVRWLRALILLAPTSLGCKVYDESLLLRRDAARDDLQVLDAARDVSTPLDRPDLVTSDLVDAPPAVDLVDAAVPVDLVDVVAPPEDRPPLPDVIDVPTIDVLPSCDAVLRGGSACIEALSGHGWRGDDPRLISPRAISYANNRVVVSDLGTGRVVGYDLALGARATVLLGTGIVGATPGSGAPAASPLGEVTAIAALSGDALALADATTRQVLVAADGRVEALPMLSFQRAPGGLAWDPSSRSIFVSADNRILRVEWRGDGGVGAPEALVGLPCGLNCTTTFNGDDLAGVSTALNNPGGIDLDATHVYFADRDNCRVRRFRRDDPNRTVTTYAGSSCDEVGDPFVGLGTFATPSQLRLGRVSDVRVGADGSVYFIDDSRCAVFGVTPARTPGGDPIPRVVAGAAAGCGSVSMSGPPLGRLGGLGVSADRTVVFFADLRGQRVGRIRGTANGGSPTIDFPINPGPIPSSSDSAADSRLGSPDGLSVSDNGASLWFTARADGRVLELTGGVLRALSGQGDALPASDAARVELSALPPARFAGISRAASRTMLSLPALGVIAELRDGALHRLAGRFPAPLGASTRDGGDDASVDATADVADAAPTALEREFAEPVQAIATASGVLFGDANARIWRVSPSGTVTHVAGAGSLTGGMVPPPGGTGVAATVAAIGSVNAIAVDGSGRIFVADAARNVLWSIGLESPPRARIVVGTIDRRGPRSDAPAFGPEFILSSPRALSFDGSSTLYIADSDANRVLGLNVLSGQVTVLAGSGPSGTVVPSGDFGPARAATLSRPSALGYFARRVYVAEEGSGRVRVIRLP